MSMAPSRPRTFRLPGDRLAALDALAYENRSDVSKEVSAALKARIDAWRAGGQIAEAEHPLKTRRSIWVDDDLWDDLRELAIAEGRTATDEAIAAIDAHVADQASRNGGRAAKPTLRDVPAGQAIPARSPSRHPRSARTRRPA